MLGWGFCAKRGWMWKIRAANNWGWGMLRDVGMRQYQIWLGLTNPKFEISGSDR